MTVQYELYQPTKILNIHKHNDGGWFWSRYSVDPYVGCSYGCTYCYSRQEKYNYLARYEKSKQLADPFSQYIKIKGNAPQLLKKELKNKPRDIIYISGYQPIEAKYKLVRQLLNVCLDLGFPVFINEKSSMLLRDIDLLKAINKQTYVNVGWSLIGSVDDNRKHHFEPNAPSIEQRFQAMRTLTDEGIQTGAIFMPILPYIYDSQEDIDLVVKKTRDAGGQYALDAGLTLWGACKPFFYKYLKTYDTSLIEKYDRLHTDNIVYTEYCPRIHNYVRESCRRHGIANDIPREVRFFPSHVQQNKRIAGELFATARELMVQGESRYREFAFRRAAWAIDEMTEDILSLYENNGINGLKTIPGVGEKLAVEIEKIIQQMRK
jgi:DNA repair photolyase